MAHLLVGMTGAGQHPRKSLFSVTAANAASGNTRTSALRLHGTPNGDVPRPAPPDGSSEPRRFPRRLGGRGIGQDQDIRDSQRPEHQNCRHADLGLLALEHVAHSGHRGAIAARSPNASSSPTCNSKFSSGNKEANFFVAASPGTSSRTCWNPGRLACRGRHLPGPGPQPSAADRILPQPRCERDTKVTTAASGADPVMDRPKKTATLSKSARRGKGTVPFCAQHPAGRSGKRGLSPFFPCGAYLSVAVFLGRAIFSSESTESPCE